MFNTFSALSPSVAVALAIGSLAMTIFDVIARTAILAGRRNLINK